MLLENKNLIHEPHSTSNSVSLGFLFNQLDISPMLMSMDNMCTMCAYQAHQLAENRDREVWCFHSVVLLVLLK